MEHLGSRIRLVRGERTQDDFASSIGVDRTTLSAYERGRREPDLKTLLIIAQFGRVSLDWLAGRHSNPSIERAQAYNDPKWSEVQELALSHNVKPVKIEQLIKAALALK
ncbi:helix-turn-helix domain-containing protein [Sporomusa sphaeroides]|uniref:HTH-type transcriptional regulator Xre n=1 Tax=Sporomusa sphaeroides DSM 2875 TaxID=1337886 RepID=A0ABP2C348_9FIRM|nr:helix-turn-helix transcriptional regulator [Sporomusa sphaeroides]OLS56325.1 HTH-type transcriptional regulator Xre [Sporomusa sphaeroides DSM 2875]CVK18420.1 HTH-type transcriptional regulator Xre [Sporomusa sphaeroides DSM 2875]